MACTTRIYTSKKSVPLSMTPSYTTPRTGPGSAQNETPNLHILVHPWWCRKGVGPPRKPLGRKWVRGRNLRNSRMWFPKVVARQKGKTQHNPPGRTYKKTPRSTRINKEREKYTQQTRPTPQKCTQQGRWPRVPCKKVRCKVPLGQVPRCRYKPPGVRRFAPHPKLNKSEQTPLADIHRLTTI